MKPGTACLCGSEHFDLAFRYDERPNGEVTFDFSSGGAYRRDVLCCQCCGHYLSVHDMDMSSLYSAAYVSATYGADGMRRTFERINSLPADRSDNAGRVERIAQFAGKYFGDRVSSLLDVGSGTAVFPYRMQLRSGWRCVALDPDARAVEHARTVAKVEAIRADFTKVTDLGSYDIITFNKVLEHVENPVGMLAKAARHLNDSGLVYIELPDGEMAVEGGKDREEFFIDHHHVFSAASLMILVRQAGFSTLEFERLREPSSKYTLRAFLRRSAP